MLKKVSWPKKRFQHFFLNSVTVSSPGASRSGFARFQGLLRLAAEELAPDQHVLSNR